MTPEQLAALSERRTLMQAQLEVLRAAIPEDDGTKAGKRRMSDWAFDVQSLERVMTQVDRAIAAANPAPIAPENASDFKRTTWVERGVTIATIPKGRRAELRVAINDWKGKTMLDLRLWHVPRAGGDWGPSGKGVSIDAGSIDALIAALTAARDAVPSRPVAEGKGKDAAPARRTTRLGEAIDLVASRKRSKAKTAGGSDA